MQQLTLRARRRGGVVVVTMSGELDLATSTRFGDHLTRLSDTGCHRLVLDTARLSSCDAAGLRVMIKAAVRARGQHGWLRLAAPDAKLGKILELVKLDAILPVYSTVTEALAGTRPRSTTRSPAPCGPVESGPGRAETRAAPN
jgi:anti-sigma B factor antagonist